MIQHPMLGSKLPVVLVSLVMISGAAQALETVADGSNASGTEKTCAYVGGRSISEAYPLCKRGDIVPITLLDGKGVMAVCDFSKTIYYVRGEAAACVYVGSPRPQVAKAEVGR